MNCKNVRFIYTKIVRANILITSTPLRANPSEEILLLTIQKVALYKFTSVYICNSSRSLVLRHTVQAVVRFDVGQLLPGTGNNPGAHLPSGNSVREMFTPARDLCRKS